MTTRLESAAEIPRNYPVGLTALCRHSLASSGGHPKLNGPPLTPSTTAGSIRRTTRKVSHDTRRRLSAPAGAACYREP